jgi:hypothetical protein
MSDAHQNEYDHEPIRGLPDLLPEGEQILWQGEPAWLSMARRAFYVQTLAIYFALLIGAHQAYHFSTGGSAAQALVNLGWQICLGLTGLAILAGMARLYARTTVYTLTNRRIVLRFGVAIPMMINLPLNRVQAADLRCFGDGTGDIALRLEDGERVSYWAIWPHARPWHYAPVIPMLRSVPEAQTVAKTLSEAAAAFGGSQAAAPQTTRRMPQQLREKVRDRDLGGSALA